MRILLRAFCAALVLWLAAGPAAATITSTSTKVVALGNGVTTLFNFSFVGVSAASIVVTFTDATGVSTVIAPTLYTLTLNAPASNTVWGVGGTVTYPLSGSPIATGTALTITRNLPYIQTTPFANLGQVLPTAIETSVDKLTMQVQQLNTLFGGALVQPLTDTQAFAALPTAAQRANLALCFDSTGYVPTACSQPASGVISSAMQPVVSAGSLAGGRTAFGLGALAVEGFGAGLQDDGAGNARVSVPTQSVASNFPINAASAQVEYEATGPITATAVRLNTLWNGYTVKIRAITGAVTFAIDANDTVAGQSSGVSFVIPAGALAEIIGDGASSGTWRVSLKPVGPGGLLRSTPITSSAGTFAIQPSTRTVRVRMVGSGGGGGGAGTAASPGGNGGAGGNTSFNAIVANGGAGGTGAGAAFGTGGGGGAAGVGTATVRLTGGAGGLGFGVLSGVATGGVGGSSAFGGAGSPTTAAGGAGAANTGAGGAGGSSGTASSLGGGGGGTGEYVELVISNPAASYVYVVGNPGAAGAAGAGAVGGAGGIGIIIVDEFSY